MQQFLTKYAFKIYRNFCLLSVLIDALLEFKIGKLKHFTYNLKKQRQKILILILIYIFHIHNYIMHCTCNFFFLPHSHFENLVILDFAPPLNRIKIQK